MPSTPRTLTEYLAALPEDRRRAIEALRKVIRKNIDRKFKEGFQNGAIGYFLPHSEYPNGYHCNPEDPLPFAGIASQKNHIGLYLFCIYTDPADERRFREEWLAAGKTLDMGKSCVRVKKLEDVPLDVVGRTFKRITAARFVEAYEASLPASARRRLSKKPGHGAPAKKAMKGLTRKA